MRQFGNNNTARSQDLWEEELEFLEKDSLDEICRLESRSYPAPWSDQLIRGEFEKTISLRLGLRTPSTADGPGVLVAYSFNYLVADELHILNLAVAPERRRQGLGRRLLQSILDVARTRGAKIATLEVRVSNLLAQDLYTSFGFSISGRRKAYYRNNGEDALVMERML